MYEVKFESYTHSPLITTSLLSLSEGDAFRFPQASKEHIKLADLSDGTYWCVSKETGRLFHEMRADCEVVPLNKRYKITLNLTEIPY